MNKIGKICLNFSTLELLISCFVSRFISKDSKIGAIVTSEMSFKNLLKTLDSPVKYDNQYVDIFKDEIRKLETIEEERNRIVHSAYVLKEDSSKIYRLKISAKRGQGLKIVDEEVDLQRFDRLVKDSLESIKMFEMLYKQIFNEEVIEYA